MVIHFVITEKIFPSTFSRAMPLNCLMLQKTFSFGIKVVTALFHAAGIALDFQATPISFHNSFRIMGQFLYHGQEIPTTLVQKSTNIFIDHNF